MAFTPLTLDAARLCDGLSRIGYVPPEAIINLIENAVTANAKNVIAVIVSENGERSSIREYLIIDDGVGMDQPGIKNALTLGSAASQATAGTASKLGFGLKHAAFSQGDTLEVLSSSGDSIFIKYRVALKDVRAQGVYGAERVELTSEDEALIREHLHAGRGTIVRITHIRQSNNFSIEATIKEIHRQISGLYSPEYQSHIQVLSQ